MSLTINKLTHLVAKTIDQHLQNRKTWVYWQSLVGDRKNRINVSLTNDFAWHDIVAPCDGFFCIIAICNSLILNYNDVWNGVNNSTTVDNNVITRGYRGFNIAVAKGWTVSYQIDDKATQVTGFFVPSIGGS